MLFIWLDITLRNRSKQSTSKVILLSIKLNFLLKDRLKATFNSVQCEDYKKM